MSASSSLAGDALDLFSASLSDKDFQRFSVLIQEICGIRLAPHKKSMLEGRLRRRLRQLGLRSFEEYRSYVFSTPGQRDELVHLIDAVTTNKTDFFREPFHFDYLTRVVFPELAAALRRGDAVRIWSAGCSTGEEPYTLAMVASEFAAPAGGFAFSVLGSDVSTRVLDKARLGVYEVERIGPIPEALKKKYLLRSRDPEKKLVRIAPELRRLVDFRRINFLEEHFGLEAPVDVLFCRNVIIYFDKPTQQKMLQRLCNHLGAGRFLFMGHSESLNGMRLPLRQIAPSVYRKID